MRVNRLVRTTSTRRPPWLEVFHAISGLTRTHGLPIPVEIMHVGPGMVRVRLESNADAMVWLRRVDPQARAVRVPDPRGRLFTTCDWMGWMLTIAGAPQRPSNPPKAVIAPGRTGLDLGVSTPCAGATGCLHNNASNARQGRS